MAKKTPSKDIKLLFAITAALIALILLSLTVLNPPQCPGYYTQQQVDASGCAVGASIGGPFAPIFIILPVVPFAVLLWLLFFAITSVRKRTSKKAKNKSHQ